MLIVNHARSWQDLEVADVFCLAVTELRGEEAQNQLIL